MHGFDHSRFFALGEGFARGAMRVRPAADVMAVADRLTRGEGSRSTPAVFAYDAGTRARDLVRTTYATIFLVSDRVIDALNGYTGWTTYPVELHGRDGKLLPGYHGLAVTGRAGPIDDALSPRRMLRVPEDEGDSEYSGRLGVLFQPDTPGITVSEPVRDALLAARVTNLRLRRITEIERTWDASG